MAHALSSTIRLGNFLEYLAELFPECRSTLKILALFLKNPDNAFTKYGVEKEAMVSHSHRILQRLVTLGILEIIDENPTAYKLNKNSRLLQQMLDFLV
ncbi:MAG: hypothetical protein LM590_00635 [Thermofilum sp.]|nr:hypothetical protein [Thermofilum sp.]